MKLAIYQGAGTPLDVSANLELMESLAQSAAQQGAELLVLPELFLTGYNIGDAVMQLAEPAQGASLQRACAIAKTAEISLIFGFPEREGDRIYNSAAWIDAEGNWIGSYHKTHLFGAEEQRLFQKGDRWLMHQLGDLTIGVLICFDIEFPEAARTLAEQGVDLIVVPTANMLPYILIPEWVVPVRALENQVYVAYANRIGTEGDLTYCGMSCIVTPSGKFLAHAGLEEALLFAEIDQAAIAQERTIYNYLQERRTDLY